MNSKKIYGIEVTKFNEENEITMEYTSIALFTSLKKAYEDLKLTARFQDEGEIYEENTPNMHVFYKDSQGIKTLATIKTHLLQ